MGKTKEILAKSDNPDLKIEFVERENDKLEILHVHAKKWRLELTLYEFGEIAATIAIAKRTLKELKNGTRNRQ